MIRTVVSLIFLMTGIVSAMGQSEIINDLDQDQYINLIESLDSVDFDKNFHILIDNQETNQNEFVLHIWNNDRLGEAMFSNFGINICDFFELKFVHVFIYRREDCVISIPFEFLAEQNDSDDYSYLKNSPFYDEKGTYQVLQAELKNGKLFWRELELKVDSSATQETRNIFK